MVSLHRALHWTNTLGTSTTALSPKVQHDNRLHALAADTHSSLHALPADTHILAAPPAVRAMYHRWCRASQHLPSHAPLAACICMRCHFRRQNASFWSSIPVIPDETMCAMHFNRQPFTSADGNDSDTIEPVSFEDGGNRAHYAGIY